MRSSRKSWAMYAVLAAAVLGLGAMQSWPATDRVPWRTDLSAELTSDTERPTLLYFTADWCPPCRAMTRRVFSHEPTADAIAAAVTPVKVDLTDGPPSDAHRLAQSFGAYALPTLILLDPAGREIGRVSGWLDRDGLLNWLETLAPAEPSG